MATACRSGKALGELADLEDVSGSLISVHGDSLRDGSAVVIAFTNNTVATFNREIRSWWGRNTSIPQIGDRLVAVRSAMNQTFINGDEMVVASVGSARDVTRYIGKTNEKATAHLLELVVSIDGVNGQVLMDVLVLLNGIEGQRRDTIEK